MDPDRWDRHNDNVFDAPCCNDNQRHYVVDYVKLPRAFDIIKLVIQIEHGYATVPDKPGLGIELDEDALENCRV